MVFSSPLFLFVFFPLFFCILYVLKGKQRDYLILFGSLVFYGWGEPRFIFVIFSSALIDYYACRSMETRSRRSKARIVAFCVVQNVSILFYFKYANFFVQTATAALSAIGLHLDLVLGIALPIGVSFIVFEKITYAVDIYRGVGQSAPSLYQYLLYVFMFPKLLAGPIVKYREIKDQLLSHQPSIEDFAVGFRRCIIGLIKKVMFADTFAEIADKVFGAPPGSISTGAAWLGALCFTLQIYCDFSGYSDMAIGMARMMGFRLPENFNFPYVSASFSEFWRRWHISLTTWIKDYLYIPLGGNRGSNSRTYFNLWICFLLSGLWHGANWNFVAWGVYNGFFLVIERLFRERLDAVGRWIKVPATLLLVVLGWVIFRCHTASHACKYIFSMFVPCGGMFPDITPDISVAVTVCSVFSLLPLAPWLSGTKLCEVKEGVIGTLDSLVVCSMGILAVAKNVAIAFNPFLYFRF